MTVNIEELRKLPVSEKLRIVEELWDDIGASNERVVLPEWQKREIKRRANELEGNPDLAITREELWRRVKESNG